MHATIISRNALTVFVQTLLNTSTKHDLSEIVDINLSQDEDSVTSLAYAQSTELWATAFAGINSSMTEQNRGNNEHLRSFLLEYPPRRKLAIADSTTAEEKVSGYKGETKALGKTSLFTPSPATKKETFQRVLKLSKKTTSNGPRLGAVATGLAPEGEIVIFAADTSRPGIDDVRGRINLGKDEEAADLDIISIEDSDGNGEGNFRVAYCTDYEVHVASINYTYNREGQPQSLCIYSTPHPDTFVGSPARPRFRCLRFLTPTLLLALQNKPSGTGSELLLIELSGGIILRKPLHKKIKSATALSAAALPFTSGSNDPQIQHAIAIAGADTSVTILTLTHPPFSPYRRPKFQTHHFLPTVHPTSITSLTFSTHNPPATPWTKTPAQYLKLASTSIANTCVVHTLPLVPHPPTEKGPDKIASYILAPPGRKSEATSTLFSVIVALLAIAMGAFFLQAFTEIHGGVPETLGVKHWLPAQVQGWIARPYMFEDGLPTALRHSASSASLAVSGAASQASEAIDPRLRDASAAIESDMAAMSSAVHDIPIVSRATSVAASGASGASPAASAAASSASSAANSAASAASDAPSTATEVVASGASTAAHKMRLRDLLAQRNSGGDTSDKANHELIISRDDDTSLSGELKHRSHFLERDTRAKRWEDMGKHEREEWKARLVHAGQWAVKEGEAVLQGVLFSGVAGAVGGAVGGG